MEMLSQVKLDWENKVSVEGLKEIIGLMYQLGEAKDRVKAGPIIQELHTSIQDLDKMADAHKRGVDAADAERVAQEARNRIVQQGIDQQSGGPSHLHAVGCSEGGSTDGGDGAAYRRTPANGIHSPKPPRAF